MATVKLLLREPYKSGKKVLNPFETRIYVVLIIDRDHIVKIKTQYTILPVEWDFRLQQKKEIKTSTAGTPEANRKIKVFNDDLRKLKDDIISEYRRLQKDYPDISFGQIAQSLKDYGKQKEKPFSEGTASFFEVLDKYISFLEFEVAEGTIKKYHTLKKSLKTFGEKNPRYATLTFSMIDHKFYDAFTKYLKTQEPRGRQKTRPEGKQRGLLIDTVGKYIECLKTFLTWSEDRKYNHFTVYKSFRNISKADRKRRSHDIVTLTLAELKQFYEHDFSNDPCHDRTRDLFCFGAFTGQRWTDIQQFDKNQLRNDIWSFTDNKTKEPVEIDMRGFAAPSLDILIKYDFRLPVISNQKFNKYIKDAAREAGIDAPVTIRRYVGAQEIIISAPKHRFVCSHTARRSCVSILLNEYNLNPVHVMEITGHSDFKTLQKYIRPDRQARREAISKTKSITEIMKAV